MLLEAEDKTYIELILDLVGERPEWLQSVSDRAAFSLLRDGYRSRMDLEEAFNDGLKIPQIMNLGRKEVQEVERLLKGPSRDE